MRKPLKIIFFLSIALSANAQHLTHDVGFFVGTATVQTDYGQRGDFLSSYGNSSLSISFIHYLHFFNTNTRWNAENDITNHLMVKTEFNIMAKEDFQHHGIYAQGNSISAIQLRAMKGSISMLNFGVQAEYYFKDLREFMFPYSEMKWNPYVSLGFKYSTYKNTLTSDLGDWRTDITVLPTKYRVPGNIAVGNGGTFSFILGAGTRYKLSEKFDLAANFNWQYFFSDAVDGLQADVIENKNNEWLIHVQVGIIYHLNFAGGIFCKR
ncbi:THC0290_0291 family protein [Polaribacter uvawellassae]|uniref:THC0290_0291 family protein n=1 Tax=Polaribacter uvawellassae TaxID=3133495 RepID=UPI0032195C7B